MLEKSDSLVKISFQPFPLREDNMGSRATCMLVVNDIDGGLCVKKKNTHTHTKRQPELETADKY